MNDTKLSTGQIQTNKGVLTFELYDDDAPIAVANFKKLAQQGYYDGLSFHRVIPNFMVQTGCPDGTGAGGPGYSIKCETGGSKQFHDRGVMSMAHRGKDTGGSQFFICHNFTSIYFYARVKLRYLIRCGWSALTPKRRRLSASYSV